MSNDFRKAPNPEDGIYLSAFNPCILRCIHANGHPTATLYMEHSLDTVYVQLSFSNLVFTEEESLFRCDYMEARDGGLPFLTILDVLKLGTRTFDDVPRGVRLELVKQIIEDPEFFDIDSPTNEFRVRSPLLFEVSRIHEVVTYILPSFYGVALGTAFIADGSPKRKKVADNEFIIRKTQKPEVYELYLDGVQPVPGNNIAYVPTMALSKKLKEFLQHRNSARLTCVFQEERQKWMPLLESSV